MPAPRALHRAAVPRADSLSSGARNGRGAWASLDIRVRKLSLDITVFFFPKLPFTKCWVSALLSSGPLRCRSCVPQINSPFLISCLYTVGELSAISVPAVLSVGNNVGARMGVGCKSLLSLGRASFLWSEGMLQCTGGGSGWGAGRRLIGWA